MLDASFENSLKYIMKERYYIFDTNSFLPAIRHQQT
jgi:hypothetical protein